METTVEQGIAWQIRANRQLRGMSQAELATKTGTMQSAISRAEDPEYGKHSIDTLVKIANAFDCALSIRFISYARLAEEMVDLSAEAMHVSSFNEDFNNLVEKYHGQLEG